MNWNTTLVLMLRNIIDDMGDEPKYSDSRLEKALLVSAQMLLMGDQFGHDYKVDLSAHTISPDPVEKEDRVFTNLVALKAACMIIGGEMKISARTAVMVKDGPSTIDTRGVANTLSELQQSICGELQEALRQFRVNGSSGGAVLGPHSSHYNYHSGTHREQDGPFYYGY